MKATRQAIKDIDTFVASNSLTAEQKTAYDTIRAELIDLAVSNINNVNKTTMLEKAQTLKTTLGM
jgi:hypothetical protein